MWDIPVQQKSKDGNAESSQMKETSWCETRISPQIELLFWGRGKWKYVCMCLQ